MLFVLLAGYEVRRSELERFLYISTFSFRGNSKKPFTEYSLNDGQDFITAYNLTKFLAETTVKKFHKDVKASIILLGSILGRSDGYFPIPSFAGVGGLSHAIVPDGKTNYGRTLSAAW